MKKKYGCISLICLCYIITGCSDKNPVTLYSDLQGGWTEIYCCEKDLYNNCIDTVISSRLVFDGKSFISTVYRDSMGIEYDTSFSGKYTVLKSDSIEFILDHFVEIFSYSLSEGNLMLCAQYSIDSANNKIGDFHSVLWGCEDKKVGIFIRD